MQRLILIVFCILFGVHAAHAYDPNRPVQILYLALQQADRGFILDGEPSREELFNPNREYKTPFYQSLPITSGDKKIATGIVTVSQAEMIERCVSVHGKEENCTTYVNNAIKMHNDIIRQYWDRSFIKNNDEIIKWPVWTWVDAICKTTPCNDDADEDWFLFFEFFSEFTIEKNDSLSLTDFLSFCVSTFADSKAMEDTYNDSIKDFMKIGNETSLYKKLKNINFTCDNFVDTLKDIYDTQVEVFHNVTVIQ